MAISKFRLTFLLLAIIVFGYHFFNLISLWSTIPSKIAIHFTNDTPDQWGSKYVLFILLFLSFLIWYFMNLLIKYLIKSPHKMNYINLTEANKTTQFVRSQKMVILLQFCIFICLIFANEALLNYSADLDYTIAFSISLTFLGLCVILPFYNLFWAARLNY